MRPSVHAKPGSEEHIVENAKHMECLQIQRHGSSKCHPEVASQAHIPFAGFARVSASADVSGGKVRLHNTLGITKVLDLISIPYLYKVQLLTHPKVPLLLLLRLCSIPPLKCLLDQERPPNHFTNNTAFRTSPASAEDLKKQLNTSITRAIKICKRMLAHGLSQPPTRL